MGSRRPDGLHVESEYDKRNGRWIATFREHGVKFLGLGPDEHSAVEDLWRDHDERRGVKPPEPPADLVSVEQLRDPAFMLGGGMQKAAAAIRAGRVVYGPARDGLETETPTEDRLGP